MKVLMRAVEPEDLELMYVLENDASIWTQGNTNAPYSRYSLKRYIENTSNNVYVDGQLRLTIVADGVAVGFVDFFDFVPEHRRAQVGIGLLPQYRNQGIGSQALCLLTDYSLNVLHLHQLYAVVSADNVASLRAFASAGYVDVAVLPQWLRLGEEWVDARLMQLLLG